MGEEEEKGGEEEFEHAFTEPPAITSRNMAFPPTSSLSELSKYTRDRLIF